MTDLMSTLYDYVLTQSESYLAAVPAGKLVPGGGTAFGGHAGGTVAPASGGAGGRIPCCPGAVPGAEPCRLGVRPPVWAYCTPKSPDFIPKLCKAILPSTPWE